MILNKLLASIGPVNGRGPPRPCDVFDTIAGIGSGGLLAILLGRYRLDITSAVTEWYNLTDRLKSQSRRKRVWNRSSKLIRYDQATLLQEAERLTKRYETRSCLFFDESEKKGPRCKYVLVAASHAQLESGNLVTRLCTCCGDREYDPAWSIFRTYPCPEGKSLRHGPTDPERFPIAKAFCATAAARPFFAPYAVDIEGEGTTSFSDYFPWPQTITLLALEEMWALFGDQVDINVVLNVGAGLPGKKDIKMLARKASWGLGSRTSSWGSRSSKSSSNTFPKELKDASLHHPTGVRHDSNTPSVMEMEMQRFGNSSGVSPSKEITSPPGQTIGRSSRASRSLEQQLQDSESAMEKEVRAVLQKVYSDNRRRYFRFAPEQSLQGTPLNDALQPELVGKDARDYLEQPKLSSWIKEVGKRLAR